MPNSAAAHSAHNSKLMSPQSAIEQFAAHLRFRDCAPGTVDSYVRKVAEFHRVCDDPLAVTRDHLYLWDGLITARKLDQNTRANYRAAVRCYLKWLAAEFGVPNLAGELSVIRQRVSDPVILHPDDLTAILHAQREDIPIHQRDAALVTLLAATGIRLEEVQSLDFGSISVARVAASKAEQRVWQLRVATAKRGRIKSRTILFGDPDTPTDPVTRHFGIWFMDKVRQFGSYRNAAEFPLFSDGANPKKRLSRKMIYRAVKAVLTRAGRTDLLDKVSPHTFRHFYATWFMASPGADLFVLNRNLGHSQIMTTQIYVHLKEKVTAEHALKHSPLRDVIAKPIPANVPKEQFTQLVRFLIPESAE